MFPTCGCVSNHKSKASTAISTNSDSDFFSRTESALILLTMVCFMRHVLTTLGLSAVFALIAFIGSKIVDVNVNTKLLSIYFLNKKCRPSDPTPEDRLKTYKHQIVMDLPRLANLQVRLAGLN